MAFSGFDEFQLAKFMNTTGKRAFKLVTLSSLYKGGSLCPPANFCDFENFYQQKKKTFKAYCPIS